MRVVNLARRPFINRRPIVRFAALLWLVGAVLLLWNVRLYRSHWQGTTDNRRELAEKQEALAVARQALGQQAQRLAALDLRERNFRVAFLNSLISRRTFPWSALFDDLEEVLPAEVKLFNIQPAVRLAADLARESRREARRRAAAERAARPGRTSQRRRGTSADARLAEPAPAPEQTRLAPDEVGLQLNGLAKSETALVELVDRLFADPLFRRPVLSSERYEAGQDATIFSLDVVYLTHRQPLAPPQVAGEAQGPGEEEPAAAGAPPPDGMLPRREGDGPAVAGADTERAGGAVRLPGTPDRAAPDRAAPDRAAPDRIASQPGTPDRGTPDRGTPDRGTPDRGFQTSQPGTPDRGTPGVSAAAGIGAPPSDAQRPGEPRSGAPRSDVPAAETAGSTPDAADRDVSEAQVAADRDREERGTTDRGDEVREPVPAEDDEEPGLRERDASSTPAIDRGGQVLLRPHLHRPGVFRDAGAMAPVEAAA